MAHRNGFARGSNQAGCGCDVVPHSKPSARETTEACDGGAGHVFMAGLKTCGSVWTCAVCSAKICRRRGREVQAAIDAHMADGGVVWMITATMPHHAGHRLAVVLSALTDSWSYLKNGNPWKRWADRIGYVGAIKGTEATFGKAGWHPHIHALIFLRSDPGAEVEAKFVEWLKERWARKIESFYWDSETKTVRAAPINRRRPEGFVSLFGAPHQDHGVRITKADKAGSYVAKMGLGREVSVMDVKGGRLGNRTPWRILSDYTDRRSTQDAALWSEWCRTMKGRAHLVWSPGLRARLVAGQLEIPDMEIAAATPPKSKLIFDFEPISWWGFQRAAARAGDDFGRIVCDVLETDGPEILLVVAQALLREAGVPGEVRHDPIHKFVWIEPPKLGTAHEGRLL